MQACIVIQEVVPGSDVAKDARLQPGDQILEVIHRLFSKGAQWLSGRVLALRPRGRGFEPHRRHCIVVLEQDTFILA